MYNPFIIAVLTWLTYKVFNSIYFVVVFAIYGAFRGVHYSKKGIRDQMIVNYLIAEDLSNSKLIRVLCFWW